MIITKGRNMTAPRIYTVQIPHQRDAEVYVYEDLTAACLAQSDRVPERIWARAEEEIW